MEELVMYSTRIPKETRDAIREYCYSYKISNQECAEKAYSLLFAEEASVLMPDDIDW